MEKDKNYSIGTNNEKSLHKQIKGLYGEEENFETLVGNYIVDVVNDNQCIEIQTKNFYAIKPKLINLLEEGRNVILVHPIAVTKYLITVTEDGEVIGKRKSPKKGKIEDVFKELVNAWEVIKYYNFSLHILLVNCEEYRVTDGKGSYRRRGVSIGDRYFTEVVDTVKLQGPKDYLEFIPQCFYSGEEFTNKELAKEKGTTTPMATKITYTLNKVGLLENTGKRGREKLYKCIKK